MEGGTATAHRQAGVVRDDAWDAGIARQARRRRPALAHCCFAIQREPLCCSRPGQFHGTPSIYPRRAALLVCAIVTTHTPAFPTPPRSSRSSSSRRAHAQPLAHFAAHLLLFTASPLRRRSADPARKSLPTQSQRCRLCPDPLIGALPNSLWPS